MIPEDESLWEIENYEAFLAERRKMLAQHLNRFLSSLTETAEAQLPVSIEDLIAESESDELEFKSTLRWDMRQGRTNKALEDVIIKSVAAFANWQGGTLLIGVSDEGEILGLEADYASLNGDHDRFELHLRNLLNQNFGTAFVANRVKIRFHTINEQDICQIDVQPAINPVIVTLTDKNGQKNERFYVRSGNSSQELPPSEMHRYIQERFAR